jgi:hypothetical protein
VPRVTALLRVAILLVKETEMKLFKRTTKGKEKWRTTARMIDLHKTKVIFLRDSHYLPRSENLPSWIYEKLQTKPLYSQDCSETLPNNNLKSQRLDLNQEVTKLRQ